MSGIITRQQFEQTLSGSRKKRIIILSVVVVLVGVTSALGYNKAKLTVRKDQTDRVASSFMSKIFANQPEQAYEMTSINSHLTTSQDSFSKVVDVLHGKTPKVSFPSKVVTDNLATLSGTIKAKDSSGHEVTLLTIVELVREENTWRVDSLLVKAPEADNTTSFDNSQPIISLDNL